MRRTIVDGSFAECKLDAHLAVVRLHACRLRVVVVHRSANARQLLSRLDAIRLDADSLRIATLRLGDVEVPECLVVDLVKFLIFDTIVVSPWFRGRRRRRRARSRIPRTPPVSV